jgi:Mg2+ and Co2+ transporter CorA
VYGRRMSADLRQSSPFGALAGLFKYVAASESAFLEMMSMIIETEISYESLQRETTSLSNLLHHQNVLETHLINFERMLNVILGRGGPEWPEPTTEQGKDCLAKLANQLGRDYEAVIARCRHLIAKCERGATLVMYQTNISQNHRNILQGEAVAKLTRLAFFFVPLTFTTGMFGMNVDEVLRQHRNLWDWLVFSIPFVVVPLILVNLNISVVTAMLLRWTGLRRLQLFILR